MRAFLVTVLSVIAVGVMLIAYGLLAPRAAAAPGEAMTLDRTPYSTACPYYSADRLPTTGDPYMRDPFGRPYPASTFATSPTYPIYPTHPTYAAPTRSAYVARQAPVVRHRVVTVERTPRRDWKKTALVIGGSTAAGAGLGGIVGGGKGAAIGAALGGGVSTLFEALHK